MLESFDATNERLWQLGEHGIHLCRPVCGAAMIAFEIAVLCVERHTDHAWQILSELEEECEFFLDLGSADIRFVTLAAVITTIDERRICCPHRVVGALEKFDFIEFFTQPIEKSV